MRRRARCWGPRVTCCGLRPRRSRVSPQPQPALKPDRNREEATPYAARVREIAGALGPARAAEGKASTVTPVTDTPDGDGDQTAPPSRRVRVRGCDRAAAARGGRTVGASSG